MKFLVDRCAGRQLADWLKSLGHDSIYAGSLGPDSGDQALLKSAVSERRILITIDKDSGGLFTMIRIKAMLGHRKRVFDGVSWVGSAVLAFMRIVAYLSGR